MSGDLDSASGVADFRLIDPPRVSPKPVSPNRLLLLPLVFAVSIAVGLLTAFAASQLRPVFHNGSELREKFGLQLLGVVSMVMSDVSTRRERADRTRFVAASGMLLGLFIAVFIATTLVSGQ